MLVVFKYLRNTLKYDSILLISSDCVAGEMESVLAPRVKEKWDGISLGIRAIIIEAKIGIIISEVSIVIFDFIVYLILVNSYFLLLALLAEISQATQLHRAAGLWLLAVGTTGAIATAASVGGSTLSLRTYADKGKGRQDNWRGQAP